MRMSNHQLPFSSVASFRARVADDTPVHLRAKLLRREQDESQLPSPLDEIAPIAMRAPLHHDAGRHPILRILIRPATPIAYTARTSKVPKGRSLVAPTSAMSQLPRSVMLESRLSLR